MPVPIPNHFLIKCIQILLVSELPCPSLIWHVAMCRLLHCMNGSENRNRRKLFCLVSSSHILCSKQDIPCVRSKTFPLFHAGHSLCSKQDIPCVPRKRFPVSQAKHSLCSKQDTPCVPSKTLPVFQAGHCLCSKQDTLCDLKFNDEKRLSSKHIDHTL